MMVHEKTKKHFEKTLKRRANVGARNPMVIAKRKIMSMQIHDIEELLDLSYSPENLRKLMGTAFNKEHELLFDPQYGSPVYYGLYAVTKRLSKSQPDSEHYGESNLKLIEKVPGKAGPAPDYCNNRQRSEGQVSTIDGKPILYRDTTEVDPTNYGLEFNDPVQGCVADCWLIAALSSVAVVETRVNPADRRLEEDGPPIKVSPPSYFTTRYDITTSTEFYTDQYGITAYYGHLKKKKKANGTTYYKGWAPYYEKCFANYYKLNRNPPFVQNNNPDYGAINFGDPFAALEDITGKEATDNTFNTASYFRTGGTADDVSGMITKIRTGACGGLGLSPNGVVLFTKRPAVAITYFSATSVPNLANRNVAPYKYGDPVTYDCEGIAANHTFSILGLYQKDGIKYVVLRNPWGFGGGTASFSTRLQGSLATTLTSLPDPWNVADTGAEGIFGLNVLTFMRYFKTFGWAVWPA